MTSLNRPQDIPQVYKAVEKKLEAAPASEQESEKTRVIMRMREAIFKTFVLIGYPKVTQKNDEQWREEHTQIIVT